MFTKSAHLYDAIYRGFKDYRVESETVRRAIRGVHSGAKTVLDVACGTGEHDLYLKDDFDIDGIDLDEELLALAREKNPRGRYVAADMTSFDLGRKYDAILCLFSSIGYVKTVANVEQTLRNFVAHLNPGGVVLVEPWFGPESWKPGRPHMVTVDQPNFKVVNGSVNTS